jgi:hypothetical protein
MRTYRHGRANRKRVWTSAAVVLASVLLPVTASVGPASAAPAVQHLAVPAYFPPGATWTQLDQAGPAIGISVTNPLNGPGEGFDQGYADAIRAAAGAGGKVLGYVDTGYFGTTGRTTLTGSASSAAWTAQIEQQIDQWYAWYGSYGLSGIFFDDALGDCGTDNAHVALYKAVNAYTKSGHSGAFTADNPGSAAEQCYASAADVLVTFEGSYAGYANWTAPAWELASSDPDRFWHLVYGTSRSDLGRAMALSRERNAGYV